MRITERLPLIQRVCGIRLENPSPWVLTSSGINIPDKAYMPRARVTALVIRPPVRITAELTYDGRFCRFDFKKLGNGIAQGTLYCDGAESSQFIYPFCNLAPFIQAALLELHIRKRGALL